eukprot:scaffold1371_cov122-Isochrysis_galbana.AAC.4
MPGLGVAVARPGKDVSAQAGPAASASPTSPADRGWSAQGGRSAGRGGASAQIDRRAAAFVRTKQACSPGSCAHAEPGVGTARTTDSGM